MGWTLQPIADNPGDPEQNKLYHYRQVNMFLLFFILLLLDFYN
jgi:hypothetical protein